MRAVVLSLSPMCGGVAEYPWNVGHGVAHCSWRTGARRACMGEHVIAKVSKWNSPLFPIHAYASARAPPLCVATHCSLRLRRGIVMRVCGTRTILLECRHGALLQWHARTRHVPARCVLIRFRALVSVALACGTAMRAELAVRESEWPATMASEREER